MKSDTILIEELDELVEKIKMRISYYTTENEKLKIRIKELKKFVKEK